MIRIHSPAEAMALERSQPSGKTCLYRFYNGQQDLLYVGISGNVSKRCDQHRLRSEWWNDTEFLTVEWFDTRMQAFNAETAAIKVERPLHNEALNPRKDRITRYRRPGCTGK